MPNPTLNPHKHNRPRVPGPRRQTRDEERQARRLAEGLRDLWSCDEPPDRRSGDLPDSFSDER